MKTLILAALALLYVTTAHAQCVGVGPFGACAYPYAYPYYGYQYPAYQYPAYPSYPYHPYSYYPPVAPWYGHHYDRGHYYAPGLHH